MNTELPIVNFSLISKFLLDIIYNLKLTFLFTFRLSVHSFSVVPQCSLPDASVQPIVIGANSFQRSSANEKVAQWLKSSVQYIAQQPNIVTVAQSLENLSSKVQAGIPPGYKIVDKLPVASLPVNTSEQKFNNSLAAPTSFSELQKAALQVAAVNEIQTKLQQHLSQQTSSTSSPSNIAIKNIPNAGQETVVNIGQGISTPLILTSKPIQVAMPQQSFVQSFNQNMLRPSLSTPQLTNLLSQNIRSSNPLVVNNLNTIAVKNTIPNTTPLEKTQTLIPSQLVPAAQNNQQFILHQGVDQNGRPVQYLIPAQNVLMAKELSTNTVGNQQTIKILQQPANVMNPSLQQNLPSKFVQLPVQPQLVKVLTSHPHHVNQQVQYISIDQSKHQVLAQGVKQHIKVMTADQSQPRGSAQGVQHAKYMTVDQSQPQVLTQEVNQQLPMLRIAPRRTPAAKSQLPSASPQVLPQQPQGFVIKTNVLKDKFKSKVQQKTFKYPLPEPVQSSKFEQTSIQNFKYLQENVISSVGSTLLISTPALGSIGSSLNNGYLNQPSTQGSSLNNGCLNQPSTQYTPELLVYSQQNLLPAVNTSLFTSTQTKDTSLITSTQAKDTTFKSECDIDFQTSTQFIRGNMNKGEPMIGGDSVQPHLSKPVVTNHFPSSLPADKSSTQLPRLALLNTNPNISHQIQQKAAEESPNIAVATSRLNHVDVGVKSVRTSGNQIHESNVKIGKFISVFSKSTSLAVITQVPLLMSSSSITPGSPL